MEAPFSFPPAMIMPSEVGVTLHPIAFRLSQTVSIRSVSLTFSSAASFIVGCSFRHSGHDSDDRDFVDKCGDDIALYGDAVELACAHKDIGDLFAAFDALVEKGDVSPHVLTYFEDAGTGWIDPYIFNQNLGIRYDQSCDNKVCGGRDVSGTVIF